MSSLPSFFKSYLPELLVYSAGEMQKNPNDQGVVLMHLALLNLKKYENVASNNNVVNNNFINRLDNITKETYFIKGLENTANMGNPFSLFLLGMLKLESLESVVQRDKLTGNSLIAAAASKECPWALNAMGAFYKQGNSFFVQNLDEAKKCFAKAVVISSKNPQSELYKRSLKNLYICYREQLVVSKQNNNQGEPVLFNKIVQLAHQTNNPRTPNSTPDCAFNSCRVTGLSVITS